MDVYRTSTLEVVFKLRSINANTSLPLISVDVLPSELMLVLSFIATLFPSSLESETTLVNASC